MTVSYAQSSQMVGKAGTELVQRAQSDPAAFAELYDMYYPRIFNFIMRTVMQVDIAEDIASETFLKAMRGIARFNANSGNFTSWIYRIAANATTDHFRKNSREVLIEEPTTFDVLMEKDLLNQTSARHKLEKFEQYQELHEAICQLKPDYRMAVNLYYFEEKSQKEIAAILGCTTMTVKWRLHHARKKLAGLLGNPDKDPDHA